MATNPLMQGGTDAYLRDQMDKAYRESRHLKHRLEQLEKENALLRKSVYDLSVRLTSSPSTTATSSTTTTTTTTANTTTSSSYYMPSIDIPNTTPLVDHDVTPTTLSPPSHNMLSSTQDHSRFTRRFDFPNAHHGAIYTIRFHPSSSHSQSLFGTCSFDKSMRLWTCSPLPLELACCTHAASILDFDFRPLHSSTVMPAGLAVVTGGYDQLLKLWDIEYSTTTSTTTTTTTTTTTSSTTVPTTNGPTTATPSTSSNNSPATPQQPVSVYQVETDGFVQCVKYASVDLIYYGTTRGSLGWIDARSPSTHHPLLSDPLKSTSTTTATTTTTTPGTGSYPTSWKSSAVRHDVGIDSIDTHGEYVVTGDKAGRICLWDRRHSIRPLRAGFDLNGLLGNAVTESATMATGVGHQQVVGTRVQQRIDERVRHTRVTATSVLGLPSLCVLPLSASPALSVTTTTTTTTTGPGAGLMKAWVGVNSYENQTVILKTDLTSLSATPTTTAPTTPAGPTLTSSALASARKVSKLNVLSGTTSHKPSSTTTTTTTSTLFQSAKESPPTPPSTSTSGSVLKYAASIGHKTGPWPTRSRLIHFVPATLGNGDGRLVGVSASSEGAIVFTYDPSVPSTSTLSSTPMMTRSAKSDQVITSGMGMGMEWYKLEKAHKERIYGCDIRHCGSTTGNRVGGGGGGLGGGLGGERDVEILLGCADGSMSLWTCRVGSLQGSTTTSGGTAAAGGGGGGGETSR